MRRISYKRGLFAALEDETLEVVADESPIEAEKMETELIEVQEDIAEGEAQTEMIEEAVEAADTLEEYEEALEAIATAGGIDKAGAVLLNIGVEHICNKLGMQYDSVGMPSMESYGGSSTRIRATKNAQLALENAITNIWDKIVAAIKKAYNWVVDFLKAHFTTVGRMKERIKALEKKLAKAKDKAGAEIKSTRLATAMGPDPKTTFSTYTAETKKVQDVLKAATDKVKSSLEIVKTAISAKSLETQAGVVKNVENLAITSTEQFDTLLGLKSAGFEIKEEEDYRAAIKGLPFNYEIVITNDFDKDAEEPQDEEGDGDDVAMKNNIKKVIFGLRNNTFKVKVSKVDDTSDDLETTKAVDKGTLKAMLDACSQGIEYTVKTLPENEKELKKMLDNIGNAKYGKSVTKFLHRAILKYSVGKSACVTGIVSGATKYALGTGKVLLDYVDACLNAKEPAAAEAAPAEAEAAPKPKKGK